LILVLILILIGVVKLKIAYEARRKGAAATDSSTVLPTSNSTSRSRLCKELPFPLAYRRQQTASLLSRSRMANAIAKCKSNGFLHLVHDVIVHDSSASGPNLHILKKANRFMGL
jgi:hypothetical protein